MRICCYIYKTYLVWIVADLLKRQGLNVEYFDESKYIVIGTVSSDKFADLWNVQGLKLVREI